MKRAALVLIATCMLAGVIVMVSTALAQSDSRTSRDWSKLQITAYSSGLTGIFDPDTGRLYLYDANLDQCLIIRELSVLGERLEKLKN